MTAAYLPSANEVAAEQVRLYERTNGQEGGTAFGVPCVILTTTGARSNALRKTPLMRVEHEGVYAVIGSRRGKPNHPNWYHNLRHEPDCRLQDGARILDLRARETDGAERELWWDRAVAIWPEYADYQKSTSRIIPVLLLEART
jgi:deazaflavin-dependent oxidoreductase (nitroreductase family)